ncbi:MAG: glutaminyl-peptide cyclotransferase [Thermoanaerobaculia bacterium]|nr:glutaminyl-peptide cyclotransferase [Thermoanaerobaculia bacterium]
MIESRRALRRAPPVTLAGLAAVAWMGLSCRGEAAAPAAGAASPVEPRSLTVEVRAAHPHDPGAFTQGLLWHGGFLYESVGQYRSSELREVELPTGRVVRRRRLPDSRFGEGLARTRERLVQLTWRSGEAWFWDPETLERREIGTYRGEGWGLCYDGRRLVRSDGTDRLTFHHSRSFAELGSLRVTRAGRPQMLLNELECVDGAVYANVWQSDEIVEIDPGSGAVTAVIDASGLLTEEERRGVDVLNGIAHDPERGVFYLTGKYWPRLFEVVFGPS